MTSVGLLAGAAVYLSGRFNRTVVGATISGALLTGVLGTAISWHTAKSLNGLVATVEEQAEGDDPPFESARVDCVGRVCSTMNASQRTLRDEHEARLEAENLRTELERTAEDYTCVIDRCASGELGARMDPRSESDAMNRLAGEFNDMMADFEAMIDDLSQLVDAVATASDEVAPETAEDRTDPNSLTAVLQDLSDDAQTQTDELRTAAVQINQLSAAVSEVAESADEAKRLSEETVQIGKDGREAAVAAVEGIHDIERESEDTAEAIESLQEEVHQIDELIDFISEIAEQTNILALNAHIEASRAGEQGSGFAAVAHEIKELAERTKEAADNIEGRLTRIQQQTDRSVEEVQDTGAHIAAQADSVANAAEALTDIVSQASETNASLNEISDLTQEQVDTANDTLQRVEAVADTSEDIANEVDILITSAESRTPSHSQGPHSTSDLAARAERLSEELEPFGRNQVASSDGGDPGATTQRVDSSTTDMVTDATTETEAGAKPSEPDGGTPGAIDNGEGE